MTHILIADDENSVCTLFKAIIQHTFLSYTVSTVNDGAEALYLYEQAGADLMIVDYKMPGMNGPDLVRMLRARDVSLPIIMVSGQFDKDKASYAAGATLFVEKIDFIQGLPEILSRLLPLPPLQ